MIVLIPVGHLKKNLLDILSECLTLAFQQKVTASGTSLSPASAWDARRGQYLADSIVEAIGRLHHGRIKLGIIDADLFAPGMNFVFGEADRSRRSAIISLTRLRQEYYGLPADEALFRKRAAKEAIHELGHILGLPHCPDVSCVMHFSNALPDTDLKQSEFCQHCRGKLAPGSTV